jgi:hypothetical protein
VFLIPPVEAIFGDGVRGAFDHVLVATANGLMQARQQWLLLVQQKCGATS